MSSTSSQGTGDAPSGNWKMVGILLAGLLTSTFLFALAAHHHATRHLRVVRNLATLKYPTQLAQAERFCTPHGFEVLKQLPVDDAGAIYFSHFKILGTKVNPDTKDLLMGMDTAEGDFRIAVRLVNRDGWKFHNVYFQELAGKNVNLWADDALARPLLSLFQSNSGEMDPGMRQFLSATKGFVDVIQALKNMADGSTNQTH